MSVAWRAGANGGNHDIFIASPLTVSLTVGAEANRFMVVGLWMLQFSAPRVGSITFDGVPLSEMEHVFQTSHTAYLFGLVAPHVGTHDLIVTPTIDDCSIICGVNYYSGVDQVTPVGDVDGTSTSSPSHATATVTSTSLADMVVDVIGSESVLTADGGQTELWNRESNLGSADWGAGSRKAGAVGSVTMGWTLTTPFDCAVVAANLIAAAAPDLVPPARMRRNQFSYR